MHKRPVMAVIRSIGTSEGIDRLCLCVRAHARPKTLALRDVHVTAHNLFEVGSDSRVCKKILCEIGGKVNEQIHIAVRSILISYNRAEDGDMPHASPAKFGFVSAEAAKDAREERHKFVNYACP